MIWSPGVNVTFLIYRSCCRVVKFTNDNLGKIYPIHTHFLRSAKDTKCTLTPHNNLIHVSYGSWKTSSGNARYAMNFELFEFYWRIEIRYRCTVRFTETHFLSPVRTHSIYLTLICESQGMQVSSTDLLDSKLQLFNSRWSIHSKLSPVHAISEAELTLWIITKSVNITTMT